MRIRLNKIKKFLGELALIIAKHTFLSCLFLFLLALIFGGFLLYEYIIKTQRAVPEITEKPFLLEEKTYQEVLETWQVQEKKFREANSKKYSNPFEKPTLEEVTPEEELTE